MAEPKFVIGGVDHPVPTLDTLDMDESEILYDLSGVTVEDLDDDSGVDVKFSRILKPLMVIALMRANPETSRQAATKIAGKVKMAAAVEHFAVEDDARPPEPTTTSPSSSSPSSGSSASSSGPSSGNGSAAPPASSPPPPTGTPPSATPPTFDHATLAGSLQ